MVGKGAKQLLVRGRSVSTQNETEPPKPQLGSFGPSLTELSVADIDRSPYQPRFVVNHDHVEALAASIRSGSLIEPIVVRPNRDGRYELIAGEHRLHAVKSLGIEVIPALVKRVSDGEALTMATVDNIAREQLSDLEQGFAFARLAQEYDYSQAGIAELVSKPKSHVQRCMKLTELPPAVLEVLKTTPTLVGGTTGVELLHRCEQATPTWSCRRSASSGRESCSDSMN
jgi:ParB/RepB/Spo0J family partition protein